MNARKITLARKIFFFVLGALLALLLLPAPVVAQEISWSLKYDPHTFDPAAAPIIDLIEMAEPTFEVIAGLVKSGAIQGGYPDIIGEENSANFRDR